MQGGQLAHQDTAGGGRAGCPRELRYEGVPVTELDLATCPAHVPTSMTQYLPVTRSRARSLCTPSYSLIHGHKTLQVIMPGFYIDPECY